MRGLLLVLGLCGFAVHADGLDADMKQIGALFVDIHNNISDASKNAQSAADAAQMVVLFTDCLAQTPDSITALPADQQAAALADFKTDIQQEITDATAMQQAFVNGDNAGAAALFTKMNTVKGDGHRKFKKN